MSDTENIETRHSQADGDGERRPSEAQLAAVVEAAYILEAIRR